jgi:hypothetical protein
MGLIPGCGTAIFLVPYYNKGKLSLGSLFALLLATTGDAAFILMVESPASYG